MRAKLDGDVAFDIEIAESDDGGERGVLVEGVFDGDALASEIVGAGERGVELEGYGLVSEEFKAGGVELDAAAFFPAARDQTEGLVGAGADVMLNLCLRTLPLALTISR